MSTLPEQFSAARKSQLEAQLAFFQNVTAKAVEGAEKVIALNLNTTRASMEKSSAALRQLMGVKDPRDLLALTTQSQENFDSLLAYGRELFSIASGTHASMLQTTVPQPALAEPAAESFPVAVKVKAAAKAAPVIEEEVPALLTTAELDAADEASEQLEMLAPKPRRKK